MNTKLKWALLLGSTFSILAFQNCARDLNSGFSSLSQESKSKTAELSDSDQKVFELYNFKEIQTIRYKAAQIYGVMPYAGEMQSKSNRKSQRGTLLSIAPMPYPGYHQEDVVIVLDHKSERVYVPHSVAPAVYCPFEGNQKETEMAVPPAEHASYQELREALVAAKLVRAEGPQAADAGEGSLTLKMQDSSKHTYKFESIANNIGDLVISGAKLEETLKSFSYPRVPRCPQPPIEVGTFKDIHRFYMQRTGEHFYTDSLEEGINAGYAHEGIGFIVSTEQYSGNQHQLYRCYQTSAGKHFVSTDSKCEGHTTEGSYGYVGSYPSSGGRPIYRLFNNEIGDHLITLDPNEGLQYGYQMEGILGYEPHMKRSPPSVPASGN